MTLRELPTAVHGTGPASDGPGSGAFPALSVATPALLGGVAADLRLAAPAAQRSGELRHRGAENRRFPAGVSPFRRADRPECSRASAALAALSGVPGVLLHGLPGGAKTACAQELAYGHEEAFDQVVWYKAPDEGWASPGR
jgi:hypothetical protein